MEPMRILLVDDYLLFRKGLRALLDAQQEFEVVGEAENGLEALEQAQKLMPDLILMDITMPVCDGLEATRRILANMPYVKIVILTVAEDDQSLFDAIKSGAYGYLLKKLDPDELFELLRGVSSGEAPISRYMARKIMHEFAQLVVDEPAEPNVRQLTEREHEVLQLLAQGLSNKAIAGQLAVAENTVKNHLKNILAKLHLENRVQAAVYAVQQGLVAKTQEKQ